MMARQLGCGQMPQDYSAWIPQTQRGNQGKYAIQKGLWVWMQPNSLHLAFHTHNHSSSHLQLLVARIPWPHFQWASALILFRADAWFSANFRGNIIFFSSDQTFFY
jgi:hypothetical protein